MMNDESIIGEMMQEEVVQQEEVGQQDKVGAEVEVQAQPAPQGKPLWRSKTAWINFLVGLSAVMALVAGPEFPVPLGEVVLKYVVFGQAVINIFLRVMTVGPVGK